jgi:heat shock protein HslJ
MKKTLSLVITLIGIILIVSACGGEQPVTGEPEGVPEQPVAGEPEGVPEQPVAEEPEGVPEQPVAEEPEGVPEQPVAATPTEEPAGVPEQPVALTPVPTQEAVAEPSVPSDADDDLGFDPELITLDTQLPYVWEVVPPTPYDESQPPGPQGLPLHVRIWIGVDDPAQAQGSMPLMYIIPVEAYSQQWEQNDNDSVGRMIDEIFQFTIELPDPPSTSGVPVLPFEEISGVQDFATQLDWASRTPSSASKNGYRFVGRFAQDMNPVTSDGLPLQYMYQGFTNDSRFLVTYFQEVTSDALPTNAEVADEFNQASSQPGGYEGFLQVQSYQLNELESSDWQPDLTLSDDLIGSLTIANMPASGIQDRVWMLTTQTTADGTAQEVGGTTDYTVIFSADGTYSFQADCNSGGGQYAVTGGMVGGLAVKPGPTTLAECGPNSDYDVLVGGLLAAQEYRVHPGGAVLELVLPSEGGSLFFTNLGSGEAVDPDAPETTLPPPESGQSTGTVIAPSGVNVRIGPGLEYATIGYAPYGTEGAVVGVSADGEWYASPNPDGSGTVGWVTSAYVEVTNPESIPVLLPQAPAPTPVPTALPPAQAEVSFWADDTKIDQGECTTLYWDVENIQAVWVYPQGEPYQQYPVTGQGNQKVCPETTTAYEMRVLHRDGTVELQAITIQVEATDTDPLANSSWQVVSLNGGAQVPIAGTTLTALFGSSGDISGDSGCNTFNGSYTVSGSSISIGPLATTQKLCQEEVNAQEQAYLAVLQSATTYSLTSSQLILFSSGSEVVRFNRIG